MRFVSVSPRRVSGWNRCGWLVMNLRWRVAGTPAFLRLIDMLAQTAALYLEGFPDPATGRRQVDLAGARQIVESLMALREKTRGKLSFEETDSLDGLVSELQMAFTRLAPPPGGKGAMPPAPRRG